MKVFPQLISGKQCLLDGMNLRPSGSNELHVLYYPDKVQNVLILIDSGCRSMSV